MSDYIVKIIPCDPYFHSSEQKAQEIVGYLKSKVKADAVSVTLYETPVFVDCGSNLETISCPVCHAVLDFNWWHEAMNEAYADDFMDLSVNLPCCGRESTLNDLLYDFPCGFSCVIFEILNPLSEPDTDCLEYVQGLLGNDVRVINAHV